MLGEIFYWVFNMSIAASVCALPILLLRMVRRIPRRIFLWLWLVPFVRMVVPVGLSSKYGLMALISRFTTKTVTVFGTGDKSVLTMMNCVMGANGYFPIRYKVNLLEDVFTVASALWITAALAALLAMTVIYIVTLGELRDARKLKDNIYLSDKLNSPAVYGIIKPRIILPAEYGERDLSYILLHEKAHIKRKDNLLRLSALIIVCMHWFNPFAWLMLKLFYSDIELACDEAVLSQCSDDQKKEYARTLLSAAAYTAEKTNVFASSFGGAKIRIRIENILSYKKISLLSLAASAVLLAAIACALLTNA